MNAQTVENSSELPLVTFNSLYILLKDEKKTKLLMKLPEKFYAGYSAFIEEKQNEALKYTQNKENSKAMKEQKIIMGSQNIMNELLSLRLSKIATLAIKTEIFTEETFATENILEDEMNFYEQNLTLAKQNAKLIE